MNRIERARDATLDEIYRVTNRAIEQDDAWPGDPFSQAQRLCYNPAL